MDDIVKQAMAKWPKVPHCYGWLGLDARGHWRMRDERAQALGHPGEKLSHPALVDFINRNYGQDERGCWYFQNGPQRVYVALEAAPYITRTDGRGGFVLHTGMALDRVDAAWMSDSGQLWLSSGEMVAMLDDRDLADCMDRLDLNDAPAADDALLAWMEGAAGAGRLTLRTGSAAIAVERVEQAATPHVFGFVATPTPA